MHIYFSFIFFTGFKLCVSDKIIAGITLDCHRLKDPDRIEEHFNKSTLDEDGIHQRVNCGKYGAIQAIYISKAENDDTGLIHRVDFGCVRIRVDNSVEDAVPVNEPAAG